MRLSKATTASLLFALLDGLLVSGFVATHPSLLCKTARLRMSDGEEEEGEPRLVLGDEAQAELSKFKSKYPTSEADYLAAARARSAAKVESTARQATDEDLQKLAEEKRAQMGDVDEWEESAKEAGNMDSQILIPMSTPGDDEGGDDPEEPKLMLF